MPQDHAKLYHSSDAFFSEQGSVWMKLTRSAAICVCHECSSRQLLIVRVEGGIWHSPGFEARLDAIWDGIDPPASSAKTLENNRRAAEFIENEPTEHDAFVVTAVPSQPSAS